MNKIITSTCFLIAAAVLSGCVSNKKYRKLQGNYTELQSSTQRLAKQHQDLIGETSELRLRVKALSTEIDKMSNPTKEPAGNGIPTIPNPPPASTSALRFENVLTSCNTYSEANKLLTDAFQTSGIKPFYLAFKGQGFVAATPIDQIDIKGNKIKEEISAPQSLWDVFRHLFSPKHLDELYFSSDGYYRWIIFVVSPDMERLSGDAVDPEILKGWANFTQIKFPFEKLQNPMPKDTKLYALLYEFDQNANSRGKLTLLMGRHITDINSLPIVKALNRKEHAAH